MPYIVKRLNADGTESGMIDSGMTRGQVERALQNQNLIGFGQPCPVKMPRFGRKVAYCYPTGSGLDSFTIEHITKEH